MAEELKSLVDVYYGDTLIGQVANGETGNVNCTGHEMTDDIHIKVPYDMKAIRLQTKSATIDKNGQTVVFPDDGYVMSAAVLTVEVPSDNEWLGEFDVDTEYRVGSIVSQNNMVYICIVKPTNNQPPTNTTYWELLSGKIQDEKIVDIITHGKLEFLPDDGYVAVRKFTANVAETPTFDGTINIESGYTTISGSYVIDESKAFDLLSTYGKVKTFNVNFGAGGPANGGDEIGFTSMTFDATSGLIKYNDKGAFAMNGGFAEYTANYGDGNGARVNFEEGTECRKEFKELFLSIADEYVEETEDELAGTWVFNDTVNGIGLPATQTIYNVNFTTNNTAYNQIKFIEDTRLRIEDLGYNNTSVYNNTDGWAGEAYKTITITSKLSEVADGSILDWLKANATKQTTTSSFSMYVYSTFIDSFTFQDGMTWRDFVNSSYNPDYSYTPNYKRFAFGDTTSDNPDIYFNSSGSLNYVRFNIAGSILKANDYIIDGHNYNISSGSGGGAN